MASQPARPGAVAARYAEGLFAAAQAAGEVEELRREMGELVRLVEATPALRALLERPDLEAEQKMAALEAALGREVTQKVMGLLGTLVRHRRGDHLEAVAEVFDRLADEAAGVAHVLVRVATPLTSEQRARLVGALTRVTDGRVVLEEKVDAEVLAGASVQVRDRLIDGTAAGRLEELRQALMGVAGGGR